MVSLDLQAGLPKITGTLSKTVIIEFNGATHTSNVTLVGDYEVSDKLSVALPTYKPLLVIRDPPGGGSYSYYENVLTTISVELEQWETFVGFDASVEATLGTEAETSVCGGFGLMLCQSILDAAGGTHVGSGGGSDFQTNDELERSHSATFTTTWSYRTSTDTWNAGKKSDVFLVLTLNIKFKDVREVSWNEKECATIQDKIKFALDLLDNKPAFAFLSHSHVENVEIPDLKRLQNKSLTYLQENQCGNVNVSYQQNDNDVCRGNRSNYVAMTESITAWEQFLTDEDKLYEDAGGYGKTIYYGFSRMFPVGFHSCRTSYRALGPYSYMNVW